MSGMALTTVSPSRVRISRSVVCVAGCCGPKLSVQRYSVSARSTGTSTACSSGMGPPSCSTFRPRNHREVMAFAAATHWIILTQREARVLLGHEDAAQIGMAFEDDAVHVIDLALHPVGTSP